MSAIIWYPCTRFRVQRVCATENIKGGMAEWLKAAVLKTVEPQGSVGSNPTSSASKFHAPQGAFLLRGSGIRTDEVEFRIENVPVARF